MDHAITKGVIDDHNCRLAIKSFYIKPSTPHPTIKQDEISTLFTDLNAAKTTPQTYLLICFSFLTALRQKEAVNAQWAEFDFKAKLWHIPKERMKGQADKKRPHTIPLSRQALQILAIMKPLAGDSPFVFVDRDGKSPMNESTVNVALKRNGYKGRLVAHGIRAFIKTFLASQKVDRNVSECVLAHLLAGGDDLENTYNRYDYLEERKEAMQMIADHLENHGMRIKPLDTV
ncbi:MAG: site-specific integrase [Pasteurellaceae bacterium]|nr:site-specific integrase [Pasteurellaceae bacterium]